MGLLDSLKTWLGVGKDVENEDDTETTNSPEEPKLDPNGATETRVKTTDTAVEALKQTRNDDEEMTNTDNRTDVDSEK